MNTYFAASSLIGRFTCVLLRVQLDAVCSSIYTKEQQKQTKNNKQSKNNKTIHTYVKYLHCTFHTIGILWIEAQRNKHWYQSN